VNFALNFFENLIKEQGFELSTEKSDIDKIYSGKFKKFVKKVDLLVSVDLLINSVKSRQTGVSYPFEYLYKNSEIREVSGWHPESKTRVRVINREMLIALKMNSMRLTDKRDIIVLCYKIPDVDNTVKHLSRCSTETIKEHINELASLIEDPKYTDSIKGVFSISENIYKRGVKNCSMMLKEIQKKI